MEIYGYKVVVFVLIDFLYKLVVGLGSITKTFLPAFSFMAVEKKGFNGEKHVSLHSHSWNTWNHPRTNLLMTILEQLNPCRLSVSYIYRGNSAGFAHIDNEVILVL